MKIETFAIWELRDKYGQLKSFSKEKANSLVINFVDILQIFMAQASASVVDTTDNSRSLSVNSTVFAVNALLGDALFGLVVGTSTTAVAVGQTKLQAKIANGNGSGQLSHGAMAVNAPSTSGSTRSFTLQRTFTNNYSAPITVNEIGIYIKGNATPWYFMIDRALSTKTINNGTSGTLTYTIQVTV